MTRQQAQDMIKEIDKEPKLRQFNVRVFMKGIWAGARTPQLPRAGGGDN
jgi:hypothetical protein